jgi:hypothetical protein
MLRFRRDLPLLDLSTALNDLARDLSLDADLIPMQRRVRRCRTAIAAILETGLPVRALATALAARGIVNRCGEPLSYGHLRVLLGRLDAKPSPKPPSASVETPASALAAVAPRLDTSPRSTTRSTSTRPDFSYGLFSSSTPKGEK